MTRIVSLVALAALCFGAPAVAQTPAEGEKIYAAQKCGVCHSIGGKGNQKGPLDSVGVKLSADEIRMWIVNAPEMTAKAKATRKPVMKAYATMPKGDLDALVAYMRSLTKK